jgi:Putative Actinobacterial Holin-X, holin superfamily III
MTTPGSTGTQSGDAQRPQSSTGELISALTDDVRALVQQEVRNAQDELTGKVRRAGKGAAMLGGAAILAALAVGSSAAVLTRTLEKFLPRATAALLTTALYGVCAALLANAGVGELRRTLPLAPNRAVDALREDVQAARVSADANARGGGSD